MIDIVERLEAHMGKAEIQDVLPDCREAAKEIRKLRSAILFWRLARYPENRPDPHDLDGRCQIQAALDLAENTLYELSKSAVSSGNRKPES